MIMKSIIDKLFNRNNLPPLKSEELVDMNVCPNCWGHQEYQDMYHSHVKNQGGMQDLKDPRNRRTFVQQFVETHITGIKLVQDDDGAACPSCRTRFKKVRKQAKSGN